MNHLNQSNLADVERKELSVLQGTVHTVPYGTFTVQGQKQSTRTAYSEDFID